MVEIKHSSYSSDSTQRQAHQHLQVGAFHPITSCPELIGDVDVKMAIAALTALRHILAV